MDNEDKKIVLENFEGPLDLLLSLIQKNEVDIYDIPIAEITGQYLEYIYKMNELDIEVASEFIVIAAQLIAIKSKMLLPKDETEEADEIDPRDELVQRLLEYRIYKTIAGHIKSKEYSYTTKVSKEQDYIKDASQEYITSFDAAILVDNLAKILRRHKIRINTTFSYELKYKEISTDEKIDQIADYIKVHKSATFEDMFFEDFTKPNIIVTFVAVLEMIKKRFIEATQREDGEIEIRGI